MLRKILAVILLLLPFAASSQKTVQFQQKMGYILIRGEVNGHKGHFILDTGKPFDFFVNSNYVPVADNKRVSDGQDASGQEFLVCESESYAISFAGKEYGKGTPVHNADFGFIQDNICSDFLGFVGYGFLKNYRFAIDYDRSVITLVQAGTLIPSAVAGHSLSFSVKFRTAQDAPHIPLCDGKVGNRDFLVFFDTGTPGEVEINGEVPHMRVFNDRICTVEDLTVCGHGPFVLEHVDMSIGDNYKIGLGYAFLKDYISVWDYSKHTIDLYR